MTSIQGQVSAILVIENRTDLIEVHVNTHTGSGSGKYCCDPAAVTLDGRVVPSIYGCIEKWIADIIRWFVTHDVWAVVTGADASQEGTGNIPCTGIALTARE